MRGTTATVEGWMRGALHAGWIAGALWALATLAAAAATPGFDLLRLPPDWLGARALPVAPAFRVLGGAVPGLLLAAFAIALRERLAAGRAPVAARIGAGLLLLAGLAFAVQGLVPFDPAHPDGQGSRLHAGALALVTLAFVPANLAIALGLGRRPGWRAAAAGGLAAAALAVALLLRPDWPRLAGGAPAPGLGTSLLLACWFGWCAWLAVTALRRRGP